MADCMTFPEDWHDFLKDYSFDDFKEVYTNGSRLIPVFRVEQLIEHLLEPQEPVCVEERLVLDKLRNIQDYARVNEINWMADGAAFAETVIGLLRGRINDVIKAQEPALPVLDETGMFRCADCNNPVGYKNNAGDIFPHCWYCFKCGKKVKWE